MTPSRDAILDLLRERRAGEAISLCAEALQASPSSPELLLLLGLAFEQAGDADRAIDALDRSIDLAPGRIEALGAVANLHSRLNRHAQAIDRLEQARAVDPRHPSIRHNLGNSLLAIGRAGDAEAEYEMAVHLKPDHHGAWHQLGVAKLSLQKAADGLICIRRALTLHDGGGEYRLSEAACLSALGRWAEAIAIHRALNQDHPADWRGHAGLAACLTNIGAADDAEPSYLAALKLAPTALQAATIWSNYLMSLQYRCDVSAERLTAAHLAFQRYLPAISQSSARGIATQRDRPLRIGFVSSDFCGHPVGRFCLPVLQGLNRDRFTVFAYSATPAQDSMTERLRASVDGWREIRGLDAAAAAAQTRADAIDVLIDLSGHTGQRRLDLFALRPAATQLGWLGYPGPYAWPGIDRRISDAIVDPPGEDGFGDGIVRLDRTPLCYAPPAEQSPKRPSRAGLTFGSFNNLAKLDRSTLAFWNELLGAFPDASLVLKGKGANDPAFEERLIDAFHERRDRIRVLDWASQESDHRAQYAEIDVALDPLVYNGATTTCEALASGAPVLSQRGDRPAGRMGHSILTSARLEDWVVPSESAIAFLRARADDLPAAAVQAKLAGSPLCDLAGFLKSFEDAVISSTSAAAPRD